MLNTTRWAPDTCECVVEYSWDPKKTGEERKHTFAKAIKKCVLHKKHSGQLLLNAIVEHNQEINKKRTPPTTEE